VRWQGKSSRAVVLAGEWQLEGEPVRGPLEEVARQAAILDLSLDAGAELELNVPREENLLGYVYDGLLISQDRELQPRQLMVTTEGDYIRLRGGAGGSRVLLLRGTPLREPVAHYGPFVMNTAEEIEGTLRDYQSGRFLTNS
jgi:redox-sensitive bicupin YhaK (pirin superfamily)